MLQSTHYSADFYSFIEKTSERSALEIVPLILKLVSIQSVVDVGCGSGIWLSIFQQRGVQELLGIDQPLVQNSLKIQPRQFMAHPLTDPLNMDRTFDLVLSLEVAEHLPQENAAMFIDTLTRLGSLILFSAAIPFQGGTHHVNEQWPEYWVHLFQQRGFIIVDCLRNQIWHNKQVAWWFAQNIFFFVKEKEFHLYPALKKEYEMSKKQSLSLVHPNHYLLKVNDYLSAVDPKTISFKRVIKMLPRILFHVLRRRFLVDPK